MIDLKLSRPLPSLVLFLGMSFALINCYQVLGLGDFREGSPGAGGGGGSVTTGAECATPSDCPAPMNECQVSVCSAGRCGASALPAGLAVSAQVAGDCKEGQCDGAGAIKIVNKDSDTGDDKNDCTVDACAMHEPVHTPVLQGAACKDAANPGKKVCNGAVTCVECNGPIDCASGVCKSNQCVPASCGDMKLNGDETDLDCGGSCGPCDNAQKCKGNDDCKSQVCAPGTAVCQAPTCSDMTANGTETDKDCGGAVCPPCADTLKCIKGPDCESGVCTVGVCQVPTCIDSITNGKETGLDCGGGPASGCADCANGQPCAGPSDCLGGACYLGSCCTPKTCVLLGLTCGTAPDGCGGMLDCNDGLKNGTETDTDCGGPACVKCAQGMSCANVSDCKTLACADNVCCSANCAATCFSCNVTGSAGVCMPIPKGKPDVNATTTCSGTKVCDGNGICKLANGQACANSSVCGSGNCLAGMCN